MKALDSRKFFPNADVARFVDDVQNGNVSRVKSGLAAGISPNAEGIKGFRPIHFVYLAKDAEVLQVLLAAGADPMARIENGNTPLHFAARIPNASFLKALLSKGADPNAVGDAHSPVIHEALGSRNPENLQVLAKAGADINAIWSGSTPLMRAVSVFSWDMAATLVDLNANVSYKDKRGEGALELFCESAAQVPANAANSKGVKALYAAFQRRGIQVPCVDVLRKFG